MHRITVGAAALLFAALGWAQTPASATQFGGQIRLHWLEQQASSRGPLAQANALQSGMIDLPVSTASLETELRASGHGLSSVVTLQQQRPEGGATQSRAWVNELYASHGAGAWQFSAGKKIVAWDVGYGFRPNDMILQEERRTLVSSTPEGRPLVMAEHFNASTAWSWVWVNPLVQAMRWVRLNRRLRCAFTKETAQSIGTALHVSVPIAVPVSVLLLPGSPATRWNCMAHCVPERGCRSFCWGEPGPIRTSSVCWLKHGGTAAPSACCVVTCICA